MSIQSQDSLQVNANIENKDEEVPHQPVLKPDKNSNRPLAVNFVEGDAPCSGEHIKAFAVDVYGDTSSQLSVADTGMLAHPNNSVADLLNQKQEFSHPLCSKGKEIMHSDCSRINSQQFATSRNDEQPEPKADQNAIFGQKRELQISELDSSSFAKQDKVLKHGNNLQYTRMQRMDRQQTPAAAREELDEGFMFSTKARCLSCLRTPKFSVALHFIAIANEVLLVDTQHFLFRCTALLLAFILTLVAHASRSDKPYWKCLELCLAYYCLTFCLLATYCGASGLLVPHLLELSAQLMLIVGFAISAYLHTSTEPAVEDQLPRWRDSRADANAHRHVD
ncbi:hypothetical protein AQUCO_00900864v1 [Aquilegia coerulea]|uniref:Uncharacterized protein n=1 Tax=Aquilegia coerulea TaxID=218851 RepID=A0A2G5EFQ4_AQUCA|nr:hypothetical protein AQUCO_00900864v1 [Aquilegia coerulea]